MADGLRHYSATELIAAGVDPRTVAGRMGHGGGGTTTLKTYTAWISEADQRAAKGLGAGMPQRPTEMDPAERTRAEPRFPYEVVATTLADQMRRDASARCGPASAADLAAQHSVSLATAKRALVLARDWGLVERDERNQPCAVACTNAQQAEDPSFSGSGGAEAFDDRDDVLLDLTIKHRGVVVARFSSVADRRSATELQQVLADAVERLGGDAERLTEYEMDLRCGGEEKLITTFVASRRRVF